MPWPKGRRRKENHSCRDCGVDAVRLMRPAVHVQAFCDEKSEMRYGPSVPLCDACIRARGDMLDKNDPTTQALREAMFKLRLGRESATAA